MIRWMLPLAVVLAMALGNDAHAGPVRIDDFKFGCETPSGRTLKPQFGDMDGVYYSEIAGNEDACAMAVKSRIANCHQHTRFLSRGTTSATAAACPSSRGRPKPAPRIFAASCRNAGPARRTRQAPRKAGGRVGRQRNPAAPNATARAGWSSAWRFPPISGTR